MKKIVHMAVCLFPSVVSIILYGLYPQQGGVILLCAFALLLSLCWWLFSSFERKRPGARQIVLLAVFTALAVVGRGAFYLLPQIKPTAAIVILTGVSMGPESGFLSGALSMFISNCFFGHGPWTLWQMVAMGTVGFLAGLLFEEKQPKTWHLMLYGGISVFLIYGALVDVSTIMLSGTGLEGALMIYGAALPFNFSHGLGTAVFLSLGSGRILRSIRRVQKKYGMMQR